VLGVPPLVFAVVALIDLLDQFWVHTRQIDRLGWFDRWFCAPSNHRALHAVGTWQPELADHPCHYGTRSPLRSWNPVWANLGVYAALWHDCRRATRWGDKLRVWLKPPGWRPRDVALRFPKPACGWCPARSHATRPRSRPPGATPPPRPSSLRSR
jgi:hypothetical protein